MIINRFYSIYVKLIFFNYFNKNNINNSLNFTYNHIYYAIDSFILLTSIIKSSYQILFSKELKLLIKQKKIIHSNSKKLNNLDLYKKNCYSAQKM